LNGIQLSEGQLQRISLQDDCCVIHPFYGLMSPAGSRNEKYYFTLY